MRNHTTRATMGNKYPDGKAHSEPILCAVPFAIAKVCMVQCLGMLSYEYNHIIWIARHADNILTHVL